MWNILRADTRGRGDYGWLKTRYTFSFADWYSPSRLGFGPLRVINDDVVAPNMGFGQHPHQDMEIISYVISGALEHRDSMGYGSVIRHGEVQYMSAGTGVLHSEYNASDSEPVHLLQIWIQPAVRGQKPRYGQLKWDDGSADNRFRLVASGQPEGDAMVIRQDARLYIGRIRGGAEVVYPGPVGRSTFVHVATGAVTLDGFALTAGDSASSTGLGHVTVAAKTDAQVLVFDLG
ncbi:MAG: pirin family protein [Myxococcales bacterium]|nr:pirin family protein [Myxococcales bacterium]